MATVTGFTAARMLVMEAATIVDGDIVGDNLILKRHDNVTIDAGNVRGPVGSPGVSQPQLDTFMEDHLPIGASIDYIGTVSPSAKWILGSGQTIVNGQTLYPTFWARIPASMKSGSNILMPNTKGRIFVGYDSADTDFNAIVKTGGEKTHVISRDELPADPLLVNPPPTLVSINPPLTAVSGNTGIENAKHTHKLTGYAAATGNWVDTSFPQNGAPPIPAPLVADWISTTGDDIDHSHPAGSLSVDIPPFNATVDIDPFNTSILGSGWAHNNIQPYVVMQKLFKVL